jgi:anti-sigma regulatory factor (Ser/Thr protein kinase)
MNDIISEVRHEPSLDITVVTLSGSLTLGGTPRLREVLAKAVAECPAAVVVDLSRLSMVDPVALTVVPVVAHRGHLLPDVAVLVCLPGARENSLVSAALGGVPTYATLDAALAEVTLQVQRTRRTELAMTGDPASVRQAREAALDACLRWNLMHVCEPVRLVVSELVTNAVIHAGGPISLILARRDPFIHIRVRDGSLARPRRLDPDVEPDPRPGGRGLFLVELYSSAWGYRMRADGKLVWATVRHRPIGPAEVA